MVKKRPKRKVKMESSNDKKHLSPLGFTLDGCFERAPHAGLSTLMAANEPFIPYQTMPRASSTREEMVDHTAC